MKRLLFSACLAFLASSTSATVLTFDDLSPTGGIVPVHSGYGGFEWQAGATTLGTVTGKYHEGTGYYNGIVSPEKAIFNYYGYSGAKINWLGSDTFTFNGAYLTAAFSDQQVSFAGFNNGVQVYTSADYSINTASPLWINLNWINIDSIQIFNKGSHWAMDNFTFNENVNVPESSSLVLLGLGLIGLGLTRRNKAQ